MFREEHGQILASLIRTCGEFELAEEALQDAFAAACERWPTDGPPRNPAAWILTTSRRRAVDRLRRRRAGEDRIAELLADEAASVRAAAPDPEDDVRAVDEPEDDRLRLIFTCCHPALAHEAQVALTLNTLGGLTTQEIARAFLLKDATLAQRLVRAKRKIKDAAIPYRVPPPALFAERLPAVLGVIYLVFNEGYAASDGDALVRRDLTGEALRLARLLVRLMPREPEVRGLLALLLLQDSRRDARTDERGALVRLEDQDRSRWDRAAIAEGLALVEEALRAGGRGAYSLQAAIAALHAEAARPEDTDWPQIVALYDALLRALPTPVVALNRAVAVAMARGPAAGLAALEAIEDLGLLADYVYLHATRAELLRRMGRSVEARTHLVRALELARNGSERAFLERELAKLGAG